MGSIRPLFTITVLVVVGAYLYVKINEGPAHSHAGAHDAGNQLAEGVPPLAAAGGGATLAQDSAAPAWPPVQSSAPPAATNTPFAANPAAPGLNPVGSATSNSAAASADAAKNGLPEVPPIPELPALPSTADITPPATKPATPLPTELPKDIPAAQYPDTPGPSFNTGTAKDATNSTTPMLTNATGLAAPGPANVSTTPIAPSPTTTLPPISNQALPSLGANGLGTTQPNSPPASNQNPLRPATGGALETGPPDRYGSSQTPAVQTTIGMPAAMPAAMPSASQPSAPAGPSFAASWPTIQAALDRGDLKQAHQLLSKWHGDDSLAPADAQKVETLLSQLAGTVIYSTEHQLEPARVVKQGETLESIAKQYNVPWQLLAKINGIPAADQLRPGQLLKVVRGPFSAVVDLHRNELSLRLDDRYAGKFPVNIQPGAEPPSGDWLVLRRLESESSTGQNSAFPPPPPTIAVTVQQLVLQDASSAAGQTTIPVVIGTKPALMANGVGSGSPGVSQYFVQVSPNDITEIADILSVGSRVTIRR